MAVAPAAMADIFQSTLSMRRATNATNSSVAANNAFQSTLSMRRATNSWLQVNSNARYFNPRSP